jgi:hypothetical protein
MTGCLDLLSSTTAIRLPNYPLLLHKPSATKFLALTYPSTISIQKCEMNATNAGLSFTKHINTVLHFEALESQQLRLSL